MGFGGGGLINETASNLSSSSIVMTENAIMWTVFAMIVFMFIIIVVSSFIDSLRSRSSYSINDRIKTPKKLPIGLLNQYNITKSNTTKINKYIKDGKTISSQQKSYWYKKYLKEHHLENIRRGYSCKQINLVRPEVKDEKN